jgi:hypothetical protein
MSGEPHYSQESVAVVTPVTEFPLLPEEEVSLRHLRHYLGHFRRYIIGPNSLPSEFSDFKLKRFPSHYFTDRFGYNRLMLTEKFYRAFEAYEYVLIYQLDCLVFSDQLQDWCGRGWDYVGAPWLKNVNDPNEGFSRVGNGGLSLRRVAAALQVLNSKKHVEDPEVLANSRGDRSKSVYEALEQAPLLKRMFAKAKGILHLLGYHNNARWLARQMADYRYHEDNFWSYEASKGMTNFRIPTPDEAVGFSFEMAPSYCFERNSRRMPFGCHAWAKYEREFWEPFLLTNSMDQK